MSPAYELEERLDELAVQADVVLPPAECIGHEVSQLLLDLLAILCLTMPDRTRFIRKEV